MQVGEVVTPLQRRVKSLICFYFFSIFFLRSFILLLLFFPFDSFAIFFFEIVGWVKNMNHFTDDLIRD